MTYEEIITDITARYPDLDTAGLEKHKRDARGEWHEYEAAFWAAYDYARSLRILKSYPIRGGGTSYGFKHDVEKLAQAHDTPVYVPNGVMIAALIFAGVPIRRADINAVPRVSPSSRFSEYDARGRYRVPILPPLPTFRSFRAQRASGST
ncbi:MAG: hypothetical protein ACSLE1_15840 [Sphingobium sp.]